MIRTYLVAAVALSVGAAACDENKSFSNGPLDMRARPDHWEASEIRVRILPEHLRSGFDGYATKVQLELFRGNIAVVTPSVAQTQVKQSFSLVTLPLKSLVAGALTFDHELKVATFQPTSALTDDTDYLVEVKKLGYVRPVREQSVFRVGSLPRVRSIHCQASSSTPANLDVITVFFSEDVSTSKVSAAATVTDVAAAKTVQHSLASSQVQTWAAQLKVPAGTAMSKKLRLAINTDVGAPTGVKLDGKYTGQADSGAFSAELVPSAHTTLETAWEPNLTY